MSAFFGVGTLVAIALAILVGIPVAVSRSLKRARALRITNPKLGLLNVAGDAGEKLIAADEAALRPLFSGVRRSTSAVPKCDVLLLYVTLNPDGSVVGSKRSAREMVALSGARIAIIASPNADSSYAAAFGNRDVPHGGAQITPNLVLTMDRRGDSFGRFLSALFKRMYAGVSMPKAWITLAPQHDDDTHHDLPVLIFACEYGPLKFHRSDAA